MEFSLSGLGALVLMPLEWNRREVLLIVMINLPHKICLSMITIFNAPI